MCRKLLFILNHSDLTGVNSFNYAVISAIRKKYWNIKIDVYLPVKTGILYHELSKICNVISEIRDNEYDIIYFNYEGSELYDQLRGEKRIFVHGLMTEANIPTRKYDKVYCFGERSLNYIKAENKVLIRNYVDCDRFEYTHPSYKFDKVLIHSSRDSQILLSPVIAAAKYLNAYVSFTGADFMNLGKKWDVEEQIAKSGVVIGYGRCAIEAMAMGKAVIIFGVNGGDGMVIPSNFWSLAETNFSGWSLRIMRFDLTRETVVSLIQELEKFNPIDIYSNYKLIQEHFDINKHIDKLL